VRLWDRVLSRQGYNEYMYSGAYQIATVDSQGRGREGADAGIVRTAREAYAANGVVYACIAVRMALFSEARFTFQSTIDKRLFGTQDLSILEYPWPNATAGELLARMEQDDSVAGNSYIRRAVPDDGSDDQLVQMRPDTVAIVSEEVTDTRGRVFKRPVGYVEDLRVLGVDRDPQTFTTGEVAHYSPCPDPKALFRGESWLTAVLRDVSADQALTTYKTMHLANGAMPGLVIKYSQKLSDATVEKLRKRFGARYGGPENAGKTLVVDEGADPVVAGSTLEQLQYEAVTKAGERRICAAAGPGLDVILGFEKGDYQAAVRRLSDLWARPHWRMACASLQHLIPDVTAPTRLWFDVTDIAALREGELQRAQSTLVKSQGVASLVVAGFTRKSILSAVESGDMSQLEESPEAPPPGISGRETATSRENVTGPGQRPPQAGKPQDLPGVVAKNLPDARPFTVPPMPSLPNGARG
jgi:hypothetical protein